MLRVTSCERSKTLDELFVDYDGPAVRLRLWDGWHWDIRPLKAVACTIMLNSPRTLEALIAHPSEVTLGEAFINGDLDVEGDLFAALEFAECIFHRARGRHQKVRETFARLLVSGLQALRFGSRHSVRRDRWAISQHYDQPVRFFEPWLGKSLAYSCAYFEQAEDTLDDAQTRKLEFVCRKLRLKPNERFLDIGCGWGSLILHAASQHNVYAQGITISSEQAAVATKRIAAARMEQSCHVDLMDYRLAPKQFVPFDKIASLGMFEHVGVKNLENYFSTARKMLKPGGVFLNHGIARASVTRDDGGIGLVRWAKQLLLEVPSVRRAHTSSFIDKHVFPDGELSTISEALTAAEAAGFEVRDVENLREHYELTLRAWVANLQNCKAQIIQEFSESAYRTWLLYMAGSAAAFRRGDIAVFQTLLCRLDQGESHLPLSRGDWYLPRAAADPTMT